jgi:lipoteichoic acid synthase
MGGEGYRFESYIDDQLTVFFGILVLKLALFCSLNGLGKNCFLPSLGVIILALAVAVPAVSSRRRLGYFICLDLVCSLLFFTHSLYMKYFHDFATLYDLAQIRQLPAVTGAVFHLAGKESLFFVDFFFLPLLLLGSGRRPRSAWTERCKVAVVLILFGLYLNSPVIASITKSRDFEAIYNRDDFVKQRGIFSYQVADAVHYFATSLDRSRVSPDDVRLVRNWWRRSRQPVKDHLAGSAKGMNLIVIQVESMQNFVLGARFKGREITPNLNSLVRTGIRFTDIYDQTGDGNSSDATLLANASLYPSRQGAAAFLYPRDCFDSLPKVLDRHGYTTASMHANQKNFWNSAVFERALGFERQFYRDEYVISDRIGMGLSDKAFFEQSLEKIRRMPGPFYVFMRTLTSHMPFDQVTPEIDDFPLYELEGTLIGNYIRSMHYVDTAIGEFLKKLPNAGAPAGSVVVVYGDHRARLSGDDLSALGVHDPDEITKIPLIISMPGSGRGETVGTFGGLIDVAPTLCAILGVDTSDTFFLGADLLGTKGGVVVFRDGTSVMRNDAANEETVTGLLRLSDLILEKDMIRVVDPAECTDR